VKHSSDLMHLKEWSDGSRLREGSANWSPSGEKRSGQLRCGFHKQTGSPSLRAQVSGHVDRPTTSRCNEKRFHKQRDTEEPSGSSYFIGRQYAKGRKDRFDWRSKRYSSHSRNVARSVYSNLFTHQHNSPYESFRCLHGPPEALQHRRKIGVFFLVPENLKDDTRGIQAGCTKL